MPMGAKLTKEQFEIFLKTGQIPDDAPRIACDDTGAPLDAAEAVNLKVYRGPPPSSGASDIIERAMRASDTCITQTDDLKIAEHAAELITSIARIKAEDSLTVPSIVMEKLRAVFQVGYACGVVEALSGKVA